MNGTLLYLDSSALVKLVLPEPETGALTEFLSGWPERVSSTLVRVEVPRAARRAGAAESAYLTGQRTSSPGSGSSASTRES